MGFVIGLFSIIFSIETCGMVLAELFFKGIDLSFFFGKGVLLVYTSTASSYMSWFIF
jgi:hypothetical protein